jgi:natural product precursor
MKKAKFNGKISLNKETIANLNNENMNQIKGGAGWSGGCTDGCTTATSLGIFFNCSRTACTADCNGMTHTC